MELKISSSFKADQAQLLMDNAAAGELHTITLKPVEAAGWSFDAAAFKAVGVVALSARSAAYE